MSDVVVFPSIVFIKSEDIDILEKKVEDVERRMISFSMTIILWQKDVDADVDEDADSDEDRMNE